MPKRSARAIENEWRTLHEMMKSIPHFEAHRLDNWKAIEAMIATLSAGYTMHEIWKRWPELAEGTEPDYRSAAEDALYWAMGGEIMSPSESWQSSIIDPQNPAENRHSSRHFPQGATLQQEQVS